MDVLKELRTLVLEKGMEPEVAVDELLPRLKTADLRVVARQMLIWHATLIERRGTRAIEQKIAKRRRETGAPVSRQELIGSGFYLPDGTRVEWLLATADEHRARAGWLTAHYIAPTQLTVDEHERAAKEIEAAGVSCLADLENLT